MTTTHTPSQGLRLAALAFLERAAKVRSNADATALVQQYHDAFQGETWWSTGTPSETLLRARTNLAPWYLQERAPKHKSASDRGAALVAAGFAMPLGSARDDGGSRSRKPTRPERTESAGKGKRAPKPAQATLTGGSEPITKGFDTAHEAEAWAMRTLLREGPSATVRVIDSRLRYEATWTYQEACRRSAVHASAPVLRETRTNTSGPWMRVGTTKVTHSRG